MGRADDLFTRLTERGEEAIDDFFADRQSEELFLDFKRSADHGRGRTVHQNDMENLAKAISGFGNSEGGVIVWGVDCNDKDGAGDFAKARCPIQYPRRFASRLEGAVSGRTIPPHPLVRHAAILSGNGEEEGFVVTLIPRSPAAPHQMVPSLDFYVRAGSNFVRAPYGVLAGLFGRPPQPVLSPTWAYSQPKLDLSHGRRLDFEVRLFLHNLGPGIARDLYTTLTIIPPKGTVISIEPEKSVWRGHTTFGTKASIFADPDFRLAPWGAVPVLKLTCQLATQFDGGLYFELSYGHQSSPTTVRSHTMDDNALYSAYESLTSREITAETGMAFIETIFGSGVAAERGY